jgi:hypothetical protein
MKIFYSDSTRGFYPEVMRDAYEAAGTWPADARAVTDDEEKSLRAPLPVSYETQKAAYLDTVRTTREAILNRLAGIGLAAMMSSDSALGAAVQLARKSLLNITDEPRVVAAKDMNALKVAVLTAYREIIYSVPPDLKKTFDGVNS